MKLTVEAARMTMMARRSALDELRRDGEARARRGQEIVEELASWRNRLETASKRMAELEGRRDTSRTELTEAEGAPA